MTEPAHARPVRKARHRFSKVANARTTIEGFGKGMDVVGLTFGQFSLIDLIDAVLEITGPAHVTISTWSAGFYDVDAARKFRDDGRLLSTRFLMDSSDKRRQATPGDVIDLFGVESVRTTRSHAKFALIRNDGWDVVITSSMNLNLNPRVEQFELTDDADRCDLFARFVDSVWTDLPEGSTGDRKLPPAHGVEAVQPRMGLAVSPPIRTGVWE